MMASHIMQVDPPEAPIMDPALRKTIDLGLFVFFTFEVRPQPFFAAHVYAFYPTFANDARGWQMHVSGHDIFFQCVRISWPFKPALVLDSVARCSVESAWLHAHVQTHKCVRMAMSTIARSVQGLLTLHSPKQDMHTYTCIHIQACAGLTPTYAHTRRSACACSHTACSHSRASPPKQPNSRAESPRFSQQRKRAVGTRLTRSLSW